MCRITRSGRMSVFPAGSGDEVRGEAALRDIEKSLGLTSEEADDLDRENRGNYTGTECALFEASNGSLASAGRLQAVIDGRNPIAAGQTVIVADAMGGIPNDGRFRRVGAWLNGISMDQMNSLWADPDRKNIIKALFRYPGRLHEWLILWKLPQIKALGVNLEKVAECRDYTDELVFTNWRHSGAGSGTFHGLLANAYEARSRDGVAAKLRDIRRYRCDGREMALDDVIEGFESGVGGFFYRR